VEAKTTENHHEKKSLFPFSECVRMCFFGLCICQNTHTPKERDKKGRSRMNNKKTPRKSKKKQEKQQGEKRNKHQNNSG